MSKIAVLKITKSNVVLCVESGFFPYEDMTIGELGELANTLRNDGFEVSVEVERWC